MHHELLCGDKKSGVGGLGYLKGKGGCIEYLNINVEYVNVRICSFVYDFILYKPMCVYMSIRRIKLIWIYSNMILMKSFKPSPHLNRKSVKGDVTNWQEWSSVPWRYIYIDGWQFFTWLLHGSVCVCGGGGG